MDHQQCLHLKSLVLFCELYRIIVYLDSLRFSFAFLAASAAALISSGDLISSSRPTHSNDIVYLKESHLHQFPIHRLQDRTLVPPNILVDSANILDSSEIHQSLMSSVLCDATTRSITSVRTLARPISKSLSCPIVIPILYIRHY